VAPPRSWIEVEDVPLTGVWSCRYRGRMAGRGRADSAEGGGVAAEFHLTGGPRFIAELRNRETGSWPLLSLLAHATPPATSVLSETMRGPRIGDPLLRQVTNRPAT
jgi:hypothetical protein